ncbi:biotin synthase [Desulfotomaculum arcticum]|uniref:Biotin synthase n=1 Tax=Desulfotruncus arcticus DSM 17038 TaxID=1121424 RepID=A0A1I2W503_9FIRM|nr:biotin synthase BioB [Desulfotruncus arcticus]SFG95707.1 biotin synthase [Desulfotomaculum arcticum] [Desulfotruncus arcticus DSM 17038]
MQAANNEIKAEVPVNKQDAVKLNQLKGAAIYDLTALAGRVTRHSFPENKVELCSIINARSGRCSEDCAFCAQSVHYNTNVAYYPMLSPEEILRSAVKVEQAGVRRFSMVTSGRGIAGRDLEKILETIALLRRETNLTLCASLGIINEKQASMLAEAGLSTYHHNLEAAPGYFDQICTTHTYQERVQTILNAKTAGLRVCAGGILGLGESPVHQVELAFELQKLQIDSVPLNFLNPIPGTPLQSQRAISPLEILRAIAVFRLVIPRAILRLCGGRKEGLRRLQPLAFLAGANGLMVGDYLTTGGEVLQEDLQMLLDMDLAVF